MLEIIIKHTPDCMKAFLYVSDAVGGPYPTEAQLLLALKEHGIVHGIDADVLRGMHERLVCNTNVEVAKGTAPQAGAAGRMEILVDVSSKGKPRKLADGRVDHRDISYVMNITKATPLVRHIPPVPGVPGATVFNKPILPPPAPDVPFVAGKGAIVSPDDPNVFIADITGAVVLHTDGKIEVVNTKVVSGNIDYSTGNIRFSGNLRVTGTVRAGFEIDVEGDCQIGGNVEDAKIISGGEVEINGGAMGSVKGGITCGGGVKVRHIANFNVQSGDAIRITEDALHCTLSAEGVISAKNLVGGTIAAWKSVEAEAIGTEAEPKTIIDLGGRSVLMQRKYLLLKELTGITGQVGAVKESLYFLTRDEMDPAGALSGDALCRLDEMKKKYRLHREKCSQVQMEIEALDERINHSPIPSVKAQTVYPNTVLKFGTVEKIIREKLTHARITVDGENIVIGNY